MDTLTDHSSEQNTYIPIPAVLEPQSTIVETRELQLAGLVRKSLGLVPKKSPECCIYRFPARHGTNEKLYTPQRVSIGPLHHGKKELQGMEEHKSRYLQAFLDRAELGLMEDCIKAIIEWEERARCCYEEKIDFSSDELVQIFLVDGCFILESFLRYYDLMISVGMQLVDQTYHINYPEMKSHLRSDMILLENQLPFFVIDGLFSLAFPNNKLEFSLLQLSIFYFSDLMVITEAETEKLILNPPPASSEAKHFVDLLRICHLPSTPRQVTEDTTIVLVPNAVELQNAGMNFKGCSTKPSLEVEYTTGMLELGQIQLNEHSECVLGNIIALEQCRHPFDTYINDYILFMDKLVDSAKDVDILVQSGVISNNLSDSTAAAALFNGLGILTDVYVSNYYYWNISNQVNLYRNKRRNRWKAALKRDYLSNPWTIASTTAAVILLLLTSIQTICSLISL